MKILEKQLICSIFNQVKIGTGISTEELIWKIKRAKAKKEAQELIKNLLLNY